MPNLLPQIPNIGDLSRFWLSCLGPLVFYCSQNFKLFGFPIFAFELMKVIPETRHMH